MKEQPRCERNSPFLTLWEEAATGLHQKIRDNEELRDYELAGLAEGKKRGKSPDVPIEVLFRSLTKQWSDLKNAYTDNKYGNSDELKKCLADLRNVAGIFFLQCLIPELTLEEQEEEIEDTDIDGCYEMGEGFYPKELGDKTE